MEKLSNKDLVEKAGKVMLVIFDVDGVLTDGKITYTSQGEEIKSFNVRDGYGIARARDAGLKLAIVSGRYSKVTEVRAKELKIDIIMQPVKDKGEAVSQITENLNIPLNLTVFIGDDVIDIPAMERVGLAVAVADAHPEALEAANWVTSASGGNGAVRELLDVILKARQLSG